MQMDLPHVRIEVRSPDFRLEKMSTPPFLVNIQRSMITEMDIALSQTNPGCVFFVKQWL